MNFIANNIKHLRELKNHTQEFFANELDISRERVASYEQGRSSPPVEILIELSNYFNLPIDVLIKNDDFFIFLKIFMLNNLSVSFV